MDCVPSKLVLDELGIRISYDTLAPGQGVLYFPYKGKVIDVSGVNLTSFSRLMRSAVYAAALYGIYGPTYLEDTDLSVGFFLDEGIVHFHVLEGCEILYSKRVDMLKSMEEVGRLSLWTVRNPLDPKPINQEIGTPLISINSSLLAKLKS